MSTRGLVILVEVPGSVSGQVIQTDPGEEISLHSIFNAVSEIFPWRVTRLIMDAYAAMTETGQLTAVMTGHQITVSVFKVDAFNLA